MPRPPVAVLVAVLAAGCSPREEAQPPDPYPLAPLAVSNGALGAIVSWMEVSPGGIDVQTQRFGTSPSGAVRVATIAGATEGGYQVPALQAAADGEGGVILVWTDFLKGTDVDLYAQRIGADGQARWAAGGVPVCSRAGSDPVYVADDHLAVVSDGAGGAIVAWTAGPASDTAIAAQRLAGQDGGPLWGACGRTVNGAATGAIAPRLVSDGARGAVVAWWRFYGGGIVAQRIDAAGAPLWASAVSLSATGANHAAVSDGAGGAIVAYFTVMGVHAQRVNASGAVLWGAGGVPLSPGANGIQEYPVVAADGAGGAIVAWWDHRGHSYDIAFAPSIRAQRIGAAGTLEWGGGAVVCGTPVPRSVPGPIVVPDGAGGAIFAWADERDGAADPNVIAQRVDAAGSPVWTANGVHVTNAPGSQFAPAGVPDGAGGALLWFQDYQSAEHPTIGGAHVAPDGSLP